MFQFFNMGFPLIGLISYYDYHYGSVSTKGEGQGGFSLPPPHFFGNFKELLRKRCFQPPPPPHFESLVSPPTFKVAPRPLWIDDACFDSDLQTDMLGDDFILDLSIIL